MTASTREVFTKLRTLLLITLFLLIVPTAESAPVKPEVFGLRIGMSEESVHKRMRKIARQEKEEREEEEEGEQEVWVLKKDLRYHYILTKFSRDHRLILVTVMTHPNQVKYADLGDLKSATLATDGTNYSYKWKLPAQGKESALLIVARGSNADFLTSYSVYGSR